MNDSTGNHPNLPREPHQAPGFWRSRIGMGLVAALAVIGVLLGYEHRVHILGSDG